jgi:hypothetical protein
MGTARTPSRTVAMTDNTRNDPTIGAVAGEAALIATFYGPSDRELIRQLHRRLYWAFPPESQATSVQDEWKNPAAGTIGFCFEPPGRAAQDTTAVQLALNAPGDAATAWKTGRQKLEEAVEAFDAKALEGLWGYTLVYQARLKEGVTRDYALDTLIASIKRLRGKERLRPLVKTDVPDDGRVWLLGTANRVDGLAAGTVYCALGPPKAEEALLDMFYGDRAVLLTPDLIAHKGYYQMRQYRGSDLERRYRESMSYLREITEDLLDTLEQRQEVDDKLGDLFGMYTRLVPVLSGLKELHVSMRQQSENYDRWREHYERWRERVEANGVIEFHRDQIGGAALELQLMIEPFQDALETAAKAVSVAQVQVEKKQEANQRRLEALLTVGALSLALAELVDWRATKALFGEPLPSDLTLLRTQVSIVVVFFVFLWLLFVRRRR